MVHKMTYNWICIILNMQIWLLYLLHTALSSLADSNSDLFYLLNQAQFHLKPKLISVDGNGLCHKQSLNNGSLKWPTIDDLYIMMTVLKKTKDLD